MLIKYIIKSRNVTAFLTIALGSRTLNLSWCSWCSLIEQLLKQTSTLPHRLVCPIRFQTVPFLLWFIGKTAKWKKVTETVCFWDWYNEYVMLAFGLFHMTLAAIRLVGQMPLFKIYETFNSFWREESDDLDIMWADRSCSEGRWN